MTIEQAIHNFWSSFGLTAYDENSVPDNAKLPYITYSVNVGDITSGPVTTQASLWYRSMSWKEITEKSDEIRNYLGIGGVMIEHDDGAIWIKRGNTFAQRSAAGSSESEQDSSTRRVVLTVDIDFINN